MRRLNRYIRAGSKRLRLGYTTGTCAAAAASAAAELLLRGEAIATVRVETPAGIEVELDVEDSEQGVGWAQCSVRKDAGDDPDVTDGVEVIARVTHTDAPNVAVDGGVGVGRVTLPGLDQPVGEAAINSVPRAMICEAVRAVAREAGYTGGLAVKISIPAGVELAARTFNPQLGIEGGISVLGTSGIVRPMSEQALVASIELELKVLYERGVRNLVVVPGNYGRDFATSALGLGEEDLVSCSNYLGEALDAATLIGFKSFLLVGHIGKLAKVAAGAMNTHSRVADGRAEALATHAALAGASQETVAAIMASVTTDAMVSLLKDAGLLDQAMQSLTDRLGQRLSRRAGDSMQVEAVVFSNVEGLLGQTVGAPDLCKLHRTPDTSSARKEGLA